MPLHLSLLCCCFYPPSLCLFHSCVTPATPVLSSTALKLCQQESATTHQDQTLSHRCLRHNSHMHTHKQRVQHVSILCARLGDRNPVNTLSFEGWRWRVLFHSGRLVEVLTRRHGTHPVYISTHTLIYAIIVMYHIVFISLQCINTLSIHC